jgi:hypothetical protein
MEYMTNPMSLQHLGFWFGQRQYADSYPTVYRLSKYEQRGSHLMPRPKSAIGSRVRVDVLVAVAARGLGLVLKCAVTINRAGDD